MVEHDLPKVGVAGSSPVFRSFCEEISTLVSFFLYDKMEEGASFGVKSGASINSMCPPRSEHIPRKILSVICLFLGEYLCNTVSIPLHLLERINAFIQFQKTFQFYLNLSKYNNFSIKINYNYIFLFLHFPFHIYINEVANRNIPYIYSAVQLIVKFNFKYPVTYEI